MNDHQRSTVVAPARTPAQLKVLLIEDNPGDALLMRELLAGVLYGPDRLHQAVVGRLGLPPDRLFRDSLDEIRRFSATGDFVDDLCLVGVEIARLEGKSPS